MGKLVWLNLQSTTEIHYKTFLQMQSRYSKNTLYTEVSGRFKISVTVAWVEVKCFWQSSLLELDSAKHFSICSWALLNQSPEVTSLLTASLQLLEVTPLVGTSPLPQPLTHMMEQTYGMTYPRSAVGLASYWRTVSICKWHMAADAHGSSPLPVFQTAHSDPAQIAEN